MKNLLGTEHAYASHKPFGFPGFKINFILFYFNAASVAFYVYRKRYSCMSGPWKIRPAKTSIHTK